jgi:penicillin V acylase-like amidase (Ntn superfamily)
MKFLYKSIVSLLLLLAISNIPASACTTFCLKNKGEVLFGKNYDWMIGDGLVFVNKRGVSKEGAEEANAPKWVSKYGSVTFNQYGRENPSGGMNEAGLVIELMWLDDTVYPKADSRPALDVLEWIQYNLDNYASVDEVIRNAESVRIISEVKLHYLVSDKNGGVTTIEFLDGKFVPHTGAGLPVAALTNNTYDQSLEFSKKAGAARAQGPGSLERFTRAAEKTREFDKSARNEKEAVDYAFDILKDVAQPGYTQWSIVYDQKRAQIYFRSLESAAVKSIDTKAFDYSCGSAVKIFDVNAKASGDVTGVFKDYTPAANRDLIERSFNGTPFLKKVPPGVRNLLSSYPESFACAASAPKKEDPGKRSGSYFSLLISGIYSIYLQIPRA